MQRRDFIGLAGGAVASSTGVLARVATGRPTPFDPLANVAPELREGARIVLDMGRQISPLTAAKIPTLRDGGSRMAPPLLPDVPVQERRIPVSRTIPDVTVFVINAGRDTHRPAILHTHGGGFVGGSARSERRYLQEMARELDCTIVSVEYSLAPEASHARSTEENYAGLRWLHANAGELGVDRERIAVMGESAGGGHAALLAIRARDRGEVPLVLQALVYPMLDDRTGTTILPPRFIGAVGWDAQANAFGWRAFLHAPPARPGAASAGVPFRVPSAAGLPPAFIGVGGIDLFMREDVEYAKRLSLANVPVELLVVPGAYHAFDRVVPQAALSQMFARALRNALRRAFGIPAAQA